MTFCVLSVYNKKTAFSCFLSSMAEKVERKFLCSACSKSFVYSSGLCKHMKKHHPGEKKSIPKFVVQFAQTSKNFYEICTTQV